MKIFILEDNIYKLKAIVKCIYSAEEHKYTEITCGSYFNESINTIIDGDFDYAIIDNNVPRYRDDNVNFVTNAVELALEHIYLEDKSTKVIACSSEDVKINSRSLNYIGQIKYSSNSNDWEKLLLNIISKENEKVL